MREKWSKIMSKLPHRDQEPPVLERDRKALVILGLGDATLARIPQLDPAARDVGERRVADDHPLAPAVHAEAVDPAEPRERAVRERQVVRPEHVHVDRRLAAGFWVVVSPVQKGRLRVHKALRTRSPEPGGVLEVNAFPPQVLGAVDQQDGLGGGGGGGRLERLERLARSRDVPVGKQPTENGMSVALSLVALKFQDRTFARPLDSSTLGIRKVGISLGSGTVQVQKRKPYWIKPAARS